MLIYSNTLTRGNILASAPAGTHVADCDIVYGKGDAKKTSRRKRENCFRVILSGTNSRHVFNATKTRAATYDEWGIFLNEIFVQDEDAICGPYNGKDDFAQKTNEKYTCWNCDKPNGRHAVGCPELKYDATDDEPIAVGV